MKCASATVVPFLALLAVACGSSDADSGGASVSSTCTPGEQVSCACSNGTTSVQVCNADGTSLSVCGCESDAPGSDPSSSPTDPTIAPPSTTANPIEPSEDPSTTPTDPAVTDPSITDPSTDPTTTPTGTAPVTDPPPPTDPTGPIVEVPGIACGGPLDPVKFQPPYATITGRQVFIDYACNKPVDTPVTFILNLHGTMDLEDGKIYQRGYLPAYQYVDSHDFIIATPKAITSQWGNGDGGQDLPHLLETIDWMYNSFADFDIQQMWVVGHSWGAMYARDFVCRAELSSRISGVILMSGGSAAPACSDRVSIIGTVGETDIVPGEVNQSAGAAAHGCGVAETYMVGNNNVTNWPNCTPGWVHRNYFMIGKGHGFDPVDWPEALMTEDIVNAIRGTR